MKVIILAGGSGSRLWPISRDLCPKPLLSLYNGKPLIQNVYSLALSLTDEKNILIVTNIKQLNDIKSQLHNLYKNPLIISEPMAKNTLNAISVAIGFFQNKKDEIATILPVDFSIKSVDAFVEAIENAKNTAKKGYITALGIKPEYPEEGFGYIQIGKTKKNITPVIKFIEKPDLNKADEFIKSEDFFWNAGIYVSKISVLQEEISKYSPETLKNFSKSIFDEQNTINSEYYENLDENSIDYAVMEKTNKLAFVELKAQWKDYGSWQAIYNNSEKDKNGNVIDGNVIANNVSNSLIYSSNELVSVSDIEDIIIVDTEDALLVCDKNRTADIKQLVKKIKKKYDETTKIRKTVIRPWGIYTCLNRGDGWLTKVITVSPGHKLSLQSHNFRSEHWVVLEGCATIILNDEIITLNKGKSINIPIKAKHSLQNNTKDILKILEVQKGDYIGEDDIIRYEDIYGRVNDLQIN